MEDFKAAHLSRYMRNKMKMPKKRAQSKKVKKAHAQTGKVRRPYTMMMITIDPPLGVEVI